MSTATLCLAISLKNPWLIFDSQIVIVWSLTVTSVMTVYLEAIRRLLSVVTIDEYAETSFGDGTGFDTTDVLGGDCLIECPLLVGELGGGLGTGVGTEACTEAGTGVGVGVGIGVGTETGTGVGTGVGSGVSLLEVVAGGLLLLVSLSSRSFFELLLFLEELVGVRFTFWASFLSKAVRRPRSRIFSTGSQELYRDA